jgi:hypothetical protein
MAGHAQQTNVYRPRLLRVCAARGFRLVRRSAPTLRGLSDRSISGGGLYRLCDPWCAPRLTGQVAGCAKH